MFPFSFSALFRNRWLALLWGAGICWVAVSLAGSQAGADGNAAADPDALTYNQAQVDAMQNNLRSW
jgi:hypothetical protein